MRIWRWETKFSNLTQIIIQLEGSRGGIKKQTGLLNVHVYILLNSTWVQWTLNLLSSNKKTNRDNYIFNSALLVHFSTSLRNQECLIEMNGNKEDRLEIKWIKNNYLIAPCDKCSRIEMQSARIYPQSPWDRLEAKERGWPPRRAVGRGKSEGESGEWKAQWATKRRDL